MNAVGDQAGMHSLAVQHRTDDTGLAIAELAHGIEQMGRHAGPGLEGGHGLIVAGVGMANADNCTRRREPGDLCGRHGFGGYGAEQVGQGRGGRTETLKVCRVHRTDQRRVMRSLAGQGQMRPFQMQSDEAGDAFGRGGNAGTDGLDIDLGCIGNQRWAAGR